MGLLTLFRTEREPAERNVGLDLWEPTLQSHVPDGPCDLYVVVLSDRDILGWKRADFEPRFRNGERVLDFGDVDMEVKKKGVATGGASSESWRGRLRYGQGRIPSRMER